MANDPFILELVWRRHVTPHVQHLAFRRNDGGLLDFVPGQFLNLHFTTPAGHTHRSYSIANPPGQEGLLEIAVSPVAGGLASGALAALEPGDLIKATGPFGRFVLREEPPCRYLLVGTGTGITPYRAMLPALAGRLDAGFGVHIVLGVRCREELLFGADFLAFAARYPRAEFTACFSREFPADAAPWEQAGYVQDRFQSLALAPGQDIIYLCGNPGMIDASVELLQPLGFSLKNLRREKYLSARPAAK